MRGVSLSDFYEVPEVIIKQAAEHVGGNNNFRQLLVKADVFRAANVEPIFYMNADQTMMFVTSRETFQQKLH